MQVSSKGSGSDGGQVHVRRHEHACVHTAAAPGKRSLGGAETRVKRVEVQRVRCFGRARARASQVK